MYSMCYSHSLQHLSTIKLHAFHVLLSQPTAPASCIAGSPFYHSFSIFSHITFFWWSSFIIADLVYKIVPWHLLTSLNWVLLMGCYIIIEDFTLALQGISSSLTCRSSGMTFSVLFFNAISFYSLLPFFYSSLSQQFSKMPQCMMLLTMFTNCNSICKRGVLMFVLETKIINCLSNS